MPGFYCSTAGAGGGTDARRGSGEASDNPPKQAVRPDAKLQTRDATTITPYWCGRLFLPRRAPGRFASARPSRKNRVRVSGAMLR